MIKKNLIVLMTAVFILPLFALSASAGRDIGGAWMGVYTQSLTDELQEAFNLDTGDGVIISRVLKDSPADKAGLKDGDIIVTADGTKLYQSEELVNVVQNHQPGDEIDLVVLRDGNTLNKEVVLGENDNNHEDNILGLTPNPSGTAPKTYSKSWSWSDEKVSDAYVGINLESLNAQLGDYFGVKDGKGALITEVMPESPAQKANLKAGDVVVEIAGNAIENPSDVVNLINEHNEGDELEIKVLRNRSEKEFSVTLEKRPNDFYSFRKPDVNMFGDDFQMIFPRMQGLFQGDAFDFDQFGQNNQNNQNSIDQLKQEIQQMRKEIQELKSEKD